MSDQELNKTIKNRHIVQIKNQDIQLSSEFYLREEICEKMRYKQLKQQSDKKKRTAQECSDQKNQTEKVFRERKCVIRHYIMHVVHI